ncbi:MAG: cation transporter [Burkholderiales bacterium]|nr:MAG: cation transporter [Burkholderiales bacterium]
MGTSDRHPDHDHDHGPDHAHGHAHGHADDRAHGHAHADSGDHAHGHSHAHAPLPPAGQRRVFAIGIAINAAFVALEAWAGWYSGSLALLSDAGHNLGDVLGLALAWLGAWAAQRPTSARYTWGWRRGALLAALLNAALLGVAVLAIAWEAVRRLGEPAPVDAGIVVGVAAAGIVVNGVTAWLLSRGRHADVNVRGAFLHMVADAAVSAGVVVGGLVVAATGWLRLDPAISLGIAALVGWSTVSFARQSLALSMDAVPEAIDPDAVERHLRQMPGVAGLHDLHVWPLGSSGVALSAHLEMPQGHPGDAFLADARASLERGFGIGHVTLQVETGADCPQDCARDR